MAVRGELPGAVLVGYIGAQLAGAVLGAWLAHAMFDLPIMQWSTKARGGAGQWIAEAVATAGLLLVILRAPSARAAYGGELYRRRVLVHGIHVVRQSGGGGWAHAQQQLCRYRAEQCAGLRHLAVCRGGARAHAASSAGAASNEAQSLKSLPLRSRCCERSPWGGNGRLHGAAAGASRDTNLARAAVHVTRAALSRQGSAMARQGCHRLRLPFARCAAAWASSFALST